jgi:Mg-chelatase subunit ChlD
MLGTLALTATHAPEVVEVTALAGPTNAPTQALSSTPPPTPIPESIHAATAVMVPPTPTPLPVATSFQSTLKAGEIDDNQDFAAYQQYRLDYLRFVGGSLVHDVDVSERHTIHVTTADGLPVLGAEVSIYDPHEKLIARLHTTAAGLAYFFPLAYPEAVNVTSFLVVVSKDGTSASVDLTRDNRDAVWNVMLEVPPTQPPVALDVLFLLDSTGSMSDEIAALRDNLLSISARINALPAQPDVRFGLVSYRDRGDTYITQVYSFTSDVIQFQAELQQVQADGGGDTPESVNEALHDALSGVEWRGPEAVKLIILIADAPPHLDYSPDYDYAQEMRRASEAGIKINAVASSGLDDTGEYIFRQLAQFTGGKFIFLLYDNIPQAATSSEPGAPGTEHHVPDEQYSVQYLDSLIVNLITSELNALQGQ